MLGDFSRDLLQENIRKPWLEYMESFGLKQVIESPTRITNFSETLIDHIYCKTLCNILSIDVPILGLSDHFSIFITRKLNSFSVHKKSHFQFHTSLLRILMKQILSATWLQHLGM